MALEPEECESDLPTFKRETESPEETAESSFEKGEPSQRDDVPERFESLHYQRFRYHPMMRLSKLRLSEMVRKKVKEFEKASKMKEFGKASKILMEKEKVRSSSRFSEDAADFLDQMERAIILKRESGVRMEMSGETEERMRDEISLSAAKVKSDIEKVKIMLNCFNPKILNNQVLAEPEYSYNWIKRYKQRQAYQKAKSVIPNRLGCYRDEIKTTTKLLEKMFQETSFKWSSAHQELREFNNHLLDHIEKCDSELIAKIAESSVAKVEPQSKGVVSKKSALRKEDDSQRDDPGELFMNLEEMERTLVECVFRIPQQPRFITALG